MTGVRKRAIPGRALARRRIASPVDGAVDGAIMGIVPSLSHAARR
jgi:hypothetical protein